MANWVGVFRMKLTEGNGPKVAALLAQVEDLKMPGCIKYNMAIDGDTYMWIGGMGELRSS